MPIGKLVAARMRAFSNDPPPVPPRRHASKKVQTVPPLKIQTAPPPSYVEVVENDAKNNPRMVKLERDHREIQEEISRQMINNMEKVAFRGDLLEKMAKDVNELKRRVVVQNQRSNVCTIS